MKFTDARSIISTLKQNKRKKTNIHSPWIPENERQYISCFYFLQYSGFGVVLLPYSDVPRLWWLDHISVNNCFSRTLSGSYSVMKLHRICIPFPPVPILFEFFTALFKIGVFTSLPPSWHFVALPIHQLFILIFQRLPVRLLGLFVSLLAVGIPCQFHHIVYSSSAQLFDRPPVISGHCVRRNQL